MAAKKIMLQGTGSDVGKSLLAAGLCRALFRRGYKVAPFKPQNMSNNAAVTLEGGEIGRAQALQARACGLEPSVDMNPVLLKPQSEIGAQLVVCGEVRGNFNARAFQPVKKTLMPEILDCFDRLGADRDFIIVEGAGSAAEVNLRKNDIANMGFAMAADVPVVLIGDIDRGGVIASLVGTWDLLPSEEQALIQGYIINRFRGDVSLFNDGLQTITERTGMASFGVLPHLNFARSLPQEDAMSLENAEQKDTGGTIRIAVLHFSHIANFDDIDPLAAEPDVSVIWVARGDPIPGDANLVILPGSKTTISDLHDLREEGWDIDLAAHLRRGGSVLGICAGFQMLGTHISDPEGREGLAGTSEGLALLDVETVLEPEKELTRVSGHAADGLGPVSGYEMHLGRTTGSGADRPAMTLAGVPSGAISADGRVMGVYLHGLFTNDTFRHNFLGRLKQRAGSGVSYETQVNDALDQLATAIESHLDVEALLSVSR